MSFNKYQGVLKKENFDKNKKRISYENRTGVQLILLFDSVILLLNVIGEIANRNNILDNKQLVAQIIYIAIAFLLCFFVLRKRDVNYTFWIYVIEIPMLVITMLGGIYGEPHEMTFTYLIFLMLFPLLILDKPVHVSLFIIIMGFMYAFIAHAVKDPAVFARDAVHVVNIMLMAIAASVFFLTVRIQNIEYADYFAEKADEDPLTGLFNRAGARRRIHAERPGIFIYIDLDRFKGVNDRYGHEAGDQVIVKMADVLRNNFRSTDILIRLGGDEFAVYASGKWSYKQAEDKLTALLQSIHEMKLDDNRTMTASIGCAYAPDGCESLDELTRVADKAMYESKNAGRNSYHIETI